jgi:hypothetical protein
VSGLSLPNPSAQTPGTGTTPPAIVEPMRPLAYTVGDWDVTSRVNVKGQWLESTTTSRIQAVLDGHMIEERITVQRPEMSGDVNLIVIRSWDPAQQVFRIAALDNVVGLMDIYEGTLENGVLTADNRRNSTPVKGPDPSKVYLRFAMRQTGADAFEVNVDTAVENAEWTPSWKLSYTRRRADTR